MYTHTASRTTSTSQASPDNSSKLLCAYKKENLQQNADLTVKKIDILLGWKCRPIDTAELIGLDGKINITTTVPTTGGVDVGQERGGDSGAHIGGAPGGSAEYAGKFVADIVDNTALASIKSPNSAKPATYKRRQLLRQCACVRGMRQGCLQRSWRNDRQHLLRWFFRHGHL